MPLAPRYRDRDSVEVAVLEALVDRSEEGMTVFELRSHVDVGIDELETALAALKEDGLIRVENGTGEGSAVILPADRVVPASGEDRGPSTFERLRERLPF